MGKTSTADDPSKFESLGGDVRVRFYDGLEHTLSGDEIQRSDTGVELLVQLVAFPDD